MPRPMPAEEEDLYTQIKKIINKGSGETKPSKIKMQRAIPEIVTPSGNRLGPYGQNEIVLVDNLSDAKFIIDNKLGEIID